MAHAYTPGLKVTENTVIRKQRRLPIAGDVLVEEGTRVSAGDIVARAKLPGDVATVNLVNRLGVQASDIKRLLLKKEGDAVDEGEVIAETRPLIRWFRTTVASPIAGTIETVSAVTGQVILRTPPRPVQTTAYMDGVVIKVIPNEGVVVETRGAFIQGILGVGGEVNGEIAVVADGPDAVVTTDDITGDLDGKIAVAGSLVTGDVYRRASEAGVAAIICGGFNDSDLRELLGYDLGVAITGHEKISPILIVTEGFGHIAMAEATYRLLASRAGTVASANGATQIRAGVLRPEIVMPAEDDGGSGGGEKNAADGLTVGSRVRIIREPGFGRIGAVASLPPEAVAVESEAKVRVATLALPGGEMVTIPRANLEAIES